jgi:hypothetical protein
MAILEETLFAYIAAWSESDEERRRALLEQVWEENGTYSDPTVEAQGREALVQHIGAFLRRYPGYRTLLTSGVSRHHSYFRFCWVVVKPDGGRVFEGVDFGETGFQGRLHRITGFFAALSPLPASWPASLVQR